VERNDGGQAGYFKLRESSARFLQSILPCCSGHNKFGQEGIKSSRDDIPRGDAGVDTNTGATGKSHRVDGARGREETAPSIFSINAEFKRVASRGRVLVIDGAALGNSELFPD
jgi:hypothetical protein